MFWQIVPTTPMVEMIRDPDVEKAQRAMKAVLGMGKIDIAEVQRAIEELPIKLHSAHATCHARGRRA